MTMTLTEALSLTLQQPWTIDDIKPDIVFKVNIVPKVATADSKDSKTSATVAKATLSSAADFEAAARIISPATEQQLNEALEIKPHDTKTLLARLKSQAWVNAASAYEKAQNWIKAIECYRNAIYKAPDQKLKGSIYFYMQHALKNKTKITDQDALKKLCYLEASMTGHVLTDSSINAKVFAAQLIENATRNNILANDIGAFLTRDSENDIITIGDEYEIKKQFSEILAPATLNNDLAYSLKKYKPEFVLDFLAASELPTVSASILTNTLLGELYADSFFSTLNNAQRGAAFGEALLNKFKEKKFDIHAVVKKFKTQLGIIIDEQIKGYDEKDATQKAKKDALGFILAEIIANTETCLGDIGLLITLYKKQKLVMKGTFSTKTATLLTKLERVLPLLDQALKTAVKDEKAAPKAATASATTDSKHAVDDATAASITVIFTGKESPQDPKPSTAFGSTDTVSATATTMVGSTAATTPSAPAVSSGNDTKESGFGTTMATHSALISSTPGAVVSAPMPVTTAGVVGAAQQPAASDPKSAAAATPALV